jgi:hypothetical protein
MSTENTFHTPIITQKPHEDFYLKWNFNFPEVFSQKMGMVIHKILVHRLHRKKIIGCHSKQNDQSLHLDLPSLVFGITVTIKFICYPPTTI